MESSIDCVGEICPVPVVKAKIQYKKLKPGESLTVITDHSCTSQGLKDAFNKYNCHITVEEDGGIWHIRIKKLD
ncbi:sulfurtransferase TusA family protein [Clostridium swellfunianum]|uniref:sulfurtransferase TusA family protein n=1 Tax=Clostridium swellfunianum TaxID=1367462 RepID=UPI00202E1128|nr:sulfurtransferase TusA family protein [Clostridium swellfunianum]MCM0648222.1 sulfurtransferase TusA family protein [Clostridium swellfunianum]